MRVFERLGVEVVAFSSDDIENARRTEQQFRITFRLGHDLNVREFVEKTAAYFHADLGFNHATNFIVRPNGRIATAIYSSGSVGRPTAVDTIDQLEYLIKKETEGIEVSDKGQVAP